MAMGYKNEQLIEAMVNTIRKSVRTIYNDTYQMNRKYGLIAPSVWFCTRW